MKQATRRKQMTNKQYIATGIVANLGASSYLGWLFGSTMGLPFALFGIAIPQVFATACLIEIWLSNKSKWGN